MHCCNWAVLSSITCVYVSSRRPRKAFSEADSPTGTPLPRTRSYIVPSAVTKSPDSLSSGQTSSDAGLVTDVPVPADRAAAESGHPEDREHEADDAHGDPHPGDHEQEDQSDDDEGDPQADHGCGLPMRIKRKTSGLKDHEPLLGHLTDRVS